MANTILVGAQWGDEGKGKIIDVLTEQADVVVRYAGGNNAGHTVSSAKKIRPAPRAVRHFAQKQAVRHRQRRGRDPIGLVSEIEGLKKLGVKVTRRILC
jgi:adenylosuccinate synthase